MPRDHPPAATLAQEDVRIAAFERAGAVQMAASAGRALDDGFVAHDDPQIAGDAHLLDRPRETGVIEVACLETTKQFGTIDHRPIGAVNDQVGMGDRCHRSNVVSRNCGALRFVHRAKFGLRVSVHGRGHNERRCRERDGDKRCKQTHWNPFP